MRKGERCGMGVACFVVVMAAGLAARGDVLVNVDFGSSAPVSPTYVGAAVLGAAGDKWNAIGDTNDAGGTVAHTASNLALVTSDGLASGMKLSYTLTPSASSPGLGAFDLGSGSPFSGQPGEGLMRDYFFAHGGTGTFTVSGLTAGGAYELMLYSEANSGPGGAAVGRDTAFTLGGVTKDVVQGNNGTFVLGANYTMFDTTADGSGVISFSMAAGNGASLEPDVNGFQLREVAVPEPGVVWGGVVLMVGFGVWRSGRRLKCCSRTGAFSVDGGIARG